MRLDLVCGQDRGVRRSGESTELRTLVPWSCHIMMTTPGAWGEVGAPSQLGAEGHACWMHGVQVMGVVSVECGHTVAGRSFSCTLALCVLELTSWSYFFLFLGRARCTWDPWPSWQPWRPGHWDRRPPCECHSPCPAPLWGPGAVPAGSQAVCSQVTPQGHSLFFQLTS